MIENMKTTLFAVVIMIMVVLYVVITDDEESLWHEAEDLPRFSGEYLVIDGGGDKHIVDFDSDLGWQIPVGEDGEFEFDEILVWTVIEPYAEDLHD